MAPLEKPVQRPRRVDRILLRHRLEQRLDEGNIIYVLELDLNPSALARHSSDVSHRFRIKRPEIFPGSASMSNWVIFSMRLRNRRHREIPAPAPSVWSYGGLGAHAAGTPVRTDVTVLSDRGGGEYLLAESERAGAIHPASRSSFLG